MDYSKIAEQLGRRGGIKTRDKYGTDYFKMISKLGAKARKRKKIAKIDLV